MSTARTPRRFLIVSWHGGGNAVPAYHLGARLRSAGHDVHLLGWVDQATAATAAGLSFTAYPSVPPWPAGVSMDEHLDELFDHLTSERTCAEITAVVDDVRPDTLVIDGMMLAAYDAARLAGVPTVSLCHVLASLFCGPWGEQVMGRPVAQLFADVDLVLALTRREFDATGADATVTYAGPITRPGVDGSPEALSAMGLSALFEPGDPWILTSLSTTVQNQPAMLPDLLDQLADLPVRALLTLGGAVDPRRVTAPANVRLHDFVPHEAVLPHVRLLVSHGGLSGISTALAYGVPQVVAPQGRDQGFNAARVEACGVGVTSDLGELGVAVRTVLGDPSYAAAARAFGDPHAGEEATRLVEEVASR